MAIGYPPQPVYPYGIDNDYTLFLVYNTTESALAEDNEPWAEEIVIVPRTASQPEVWADNGFANINGELLYYDAVDKNSNGKVYKLRRCARSLGGAPTQFNAAGVMVRGFVVAEHHNQLVDAIILNEKFIGYNFTDDETTLDWRIRNLQSIPIIFDDFGCPDVVFDFKTVSSDPSSGTVIDYNVDVIGSFNEFLLSFGDGSTTTSLQQGTHTYAPNANLNPVVTITSQNCQIVQTPAQRDSVDAPQPEIVQSSFTIPNFPDFVFPNVNVQSPSIPEPNMAFPPFQFPCIDLTPFGISPIQIPSLIVFEPSFPLPSIIEFQPIIPSVITIIPSVIQVSVPTTPISLIVPNLPNISLVAPNLPNVSLVAPNLPNISLIVPNMPNISLVAPNLPNISVTFGTPPVISVGWATPPTVNVNWAPVPTVSIDWGSPPTLPITWGTPPAVSMNWGTPPTVDINWGSPPTIQVNVAVACPSTPLALAATDPMGLTNDMLGIGKDIQVEYDISGFPSEIKIIPPEIPDVRIVHDVPTEITVKFPEFPNLKFDVPEFRDVKILPPETQLTIEAVGIPRFITLESKTPIPDRIELYSSVEIPEKIVLEHDIPRVIRVEGLPDIIRVEHDIPSVIRVEMPEKPEIELVYKGSPIPVQVQLDVQKALGDKDNPLHVAIVPYGK